MFPYKYRVFYMFSFYTFRRCPVLDLSSFHLLDENSYITKRNEMITNVSSHLEKMRSLWDSFNDAERKQKLQEIIQVTFDVYNLCNIIIT